MNLFKRKKPSKQLEIDFEAEKKKAQLCFKFLKFIIPGRIRRRGVRSVDNRFFEH